MVRTYKKRFGAQHYGNYAPNSLKRALDDIRQKKITYRQAHEVYGIPIATLCNKIKTNHPLSAGRQTALTNEEEASLSAGIQKAAEWGFPLTRLDIRLLVKQFLDGQGKTIKTFNNNMPGVDWFYSFAKRNPILSERLCQNIKRCRAELNPEIISEYFENLSTTLQGVPPCNIMNYDETNLCDDPGRVKVVCKKGTKYVNRILDSSKYSTSLMISVTGSGKLLPPYVVYRAQHIYPTWTENGPDGAVYNRTKSGWFEGAVFEDWFQKVALPYFRRCDGKKILIGDNLSSHLSLKVIELCQTNNIEFVLLPPNATHLLQPLDVAFFAPLKKAWRHILTEWKHKNRGVLPKSEFPRMLRKLFDTVGLNAFNNIMSGFKACGIIPFNKSVVLNKLPKVMPDQMEEQDYQVEIDRRWSATFLDFLQNSRTLQERQSIKRGKKIDVPPGKGIRPCDLGQPSTSRESSSSDDEIISDDNSKSENDFAINQNNDLISHTNIDPESPLKDQHFIVNDYVLVRFKCSKNNERFFVGKITEVFPNESELVFINFLRRKRTEKLQNCFNYPDVKDESIINRTDIIKKLIPPTDLRRNRFMFKNLPMGCSIE